jgi:uncharacterized membrane protein YhaH (DUF805 family)
MELAFIIICCGSIFLTPLFISGKCNRIKYNIKIIIVNIIETLIVVFLFTNILPISLESFYSNWQTMFFLYIFFFVYNNIITVKRCNYIGLKKYNFIMPLLQIIKLIIFIFIMTNFIETPYFGKSFIIIINLTNIIQIAFLFKNEDKDDDHLKLNTE